MAGESPASEESKGDGDLGAADTPADAKKQNDDANVLRHPETRTEPVTDGTIMTCVRHTMTPCLKFFKFGNSAPTFENAADYFPHHDGDRPNIDRLDLLLKLHAANGARLQFEANWVVQRMNWLLLSQTFLIVAYVTALLDCGDCGSDTSSCKVLEKFRTMLRVLGLVHIIFIGLLIAAAASVASHV